ncbi:MAG: DUF2157 domain-containing protein [Gammaproteobacteria bacterium]|nr:DUF2157 domain-containing protein [Gammaproteobacteria bacterium]
MSDTREQALQQVCRLAREHDLTLTDITTALAASGRAQEQNGRASRNLMRVMTYLGATLVFAGIATFVGINWASFNSAARIIVTLGPGLAAFAMGWLAARDSRYTVAATPAFLIAAILVPTGLFVSNEELGPLTYEAVQTGVFGVVAVQFLLAAWQLQRSATVFLAIAFLSAFAMSLMDWIGFDGEVIAIVVGTGLILAAIGIQRGAHAVITPPGYLAGAGFLQGGVFELVDRTPFELLFVIVACALLYVGVVVRSRSLNIASIAGLTLYTAWFTQEYFANSFGWPLALITFGLVLIGLAFLGVRIDRRYLR